MIVWTIVVAAGSGERFGTAKQFERIGAGRIVDLACTVALRRSAGVVVVLPSADEVARWPGEVGIVPVAGGRTRSDSVRAGLAAVPDEADVICVHDAARPLASAELFDRVVDAVGAGADGAVPALAVTDTIKRVDGSGAVVDTPDRSMLVAVQTPQAFAAATLRRAHAAGGDLTDDAALVERHGGRVVTVTGEAWNRKITDRDDLEWARGWLRTGVG